MNQNQIDITTNVDEMRLRKDEFSYEQSVFLSILYHLKSASNIKYSNHKLKLEVTLSKVALRDC